MKKAVTITIVLLGIYSIFLYTKTTGGYPEVELKTKEDVSGKEQETEKTEENPEESSADYADEQPEVEKKYADEWEAEHVEALDFCQGVTQDDINRIGQCRNLKRLCIGIFDEELDLSPLSNLVELETIELVTATLYEIDISFLSDLTGLKKFSLNRGEIKDYSFFYSLRQLREIYIVENNAIDNLSFFSDMPNLKSLHVENVHDTDLSDLANLKNIEKIDIGGYHIMNVEKLANLSHVKELCLFEYDIYMEDRLTIDLHLLDGMTELESLSLVYISIKDISPLVDKQFLRTIILVDTGIEDIEPLRKLDNLQWLQIWGNESVKVQEQSELYFYDVKDVDVREEIPYEIWM